MQLGNFINVFLAQHVSGTYAHRQAHWMLCCSIRFSAPSFWMGCGLESRCVGRVCGAADGAPHHTHLICLIPLCFRINVPLAGLSCMCVSYVLLTAIVCKEFVKSY